VKIGLERKGTDEVERRISVDLDDALLGDVLDEIAKQANRTVELQPDGIVMRRPLKAFLPFDGMIMRQFPVPPDVFYAKEGSGDPFGDDQKELLDPRAYLVGKGIPFPEGATATFVPSTSNLIVRNTPENMEFIEAIFEGYGTRNSVQLRLAAEVYAIDCADALALFKVRNTTRALKQGVMELVEEGEAELVAFPALVTRSGQRAKAESGWDLDYTSGIEVKDGKASPTQGSVRVGCSLEVDPVIGSDGETIDVNIALSVSRGEPKVLARKVAVGDTEWRFESVELDRRTLSTAFTTLSGQPQFIGSIAGSNATEPTYLVFVDAEVIEVVREPPVPE
ncbi:MAG: hypothetical protein R3F11_26835, partial [Verrucomicrobiales bacterium]